LACRPKIEPGWTQSSAFYMANYVLGFYKNKVKTCAIFQPAR
jgi:hypothetical protein